jgi:hypothetical protein
MCLGAATELGKMMLISNIEDVRGLDKRILGCEKIYGESGNPGRAVTPSFSRGSRLGGELVGERL